MSDSTDNKQRLLIVDDSKVIRVTARKILRDHFETVEAVDGENAWEILNSEAPFSVVVSDLTMPNLDGFGLLERIRSSQQPHILDIPVIVITGSNDSDAVKQRASGAGATDFIGKPFDSVHLLARTQAHASAKAVTRSLTEKMIELEDQALVDPLTGLANETAFMERGYQQLSYAIRHDTSLSIFRIGIDHYGTLYKRHGEEITETAIKTVASILKDSIRNEDLVARTGTAHFSLLLPGMNKYGIRTLANRIISDLGGRSLKQSGKSVHISVSIGIVAPDIRRGTRFDEVLKLANKRLFRAIKQGGNQVMFEDSDTGATSPRVTDQATESAAIISSETITEMIAKSIDNGLELEEIELASPPMSAGQETDLWSSSTVIENRSPEPSGTPSSLFGGPVPDSAAQNIFAEAATDTTANNSLPPASATPAATGGKAAFTFDASDFDEEEFIVITAPLDTFEMPEPQSGDPHSAEPATTASATPEETSPAPADEPRVQDVAGQVVRPFALPEAEIETAEPPKKSGLFRRMLRGIGYLFGGRSRSH